MLQFLFKFERLLLATTMFDEQIHNNNNVYIYVYIYIYIYIYI